VAWFCCSLNLELEYIGLVLTTAGVLDVCMWVFSIFVLQHSADMYTPFSVFLSSLTIGLQKASKALVI
jgi:hypothetical protein